MKFQISYIIKKVLRRNVPQISGFVRILCEPRYIAVVGGYAIVGIAVCSLSQTRLFAATVASSIDTSKFMDLPITSLTTLDENKNAISTKMELLILKTQADVCHALEAEETKDVKFKIDRWSRENPKEGGGITCILQEGDTFEKAGVNITVMKAPLSKKLQKSMRSRGKDLPESESFTFFAAGVSSVIHPRNPHVPTMHFNYRYFEVQDEDGNMRDWWFGGGADLTPYYLVEEDVISFHKALKGACDTFSRKTYYQYKKWCDNYFFNKSRGESRGVGGIFFDDLEGTNQKRIFNFVEKCAESCVPSYIPIVKKQKAAPYTEDQRRWQLLRRGRYVEFNLVYDRGTKFGFATPGARIESILMSLPLLARWEYMHSPDPASPEGQLVEVLKNPKDWL